MEAVRRDAYASRVKHWTIRTDLDVRSFTADFVAVPIGRLFEPLDGFVAASSEEFVAPGLVVQAARMSCPDVRLVAIHFAGRIAHAPATELHAAIDEPFGADQFVFQAQHKVCVAPVFLMKPYYEASRSSMTC
jgi:hypothetical protein